MFIKVLHAPVKPVGIYIYDKSMDKTYLQRYANEFL